MVKIEEGLEELTESSGPNFDENGYTCAKYRRRGSVTLPKTPFTGLDGKRKETVDVAEYMEALHEDGEWRQHPVVFIHSSQGDSSLVYFKPGRGYCSAYIKPINQPLDNEFYGAAKELGLTQGQRGGLKTFPHPD